LQGTGAKPNKTTSPSPGKKKDHNHKPSLKNIDFHKFLYPDCKMENSQKPPNMIYLPTAEIMRKMIKACIKVETPQEILAKF
jgi:hypothetical protein